MTAERREHRYAIRFDGRPERIVVLRRVWDELTSPEF